MPWKKLYISILCFSLSLPFYAFAGGDNPSKPPVVNNELDCDDIEILLSNHKYPNPMKEEYRPAVDLMNALNNKFYAVLEGRVKKSTVRRNGKHVEVQYAEIPVYTWFEQHDGFNFYQYFQRMDYFDMWGCYRGSCCYPVNIAEERTRYVPLKKWVPWKQICEELDNPKNGPSIKQTILSEIQSGNLYGLMEVKGMSPDRSIEFRKRYTPWMNSDDHLPEAQGGESEEQSSYGPKSQNAYKKTYTPLTPNKVPQPTVEELQEVPAEVEKFKPTPLTSKPEVPNVVPESIDTDILPPPTPPKTVLDDKNIPTAKAVPGKPGFVYDPFLNDGSIINVEDIPAGIRKAKHPKTGQIFMLP